MPDQTVGRIDPAQQPHAQLAFSEYELQVLLTISEHALDAGALPVNLYAVVAGVKQKVIDGRAKLALSRRRLSMQQAVDTLAAERDDGEEGPPAA